MGRAAFARVRYGIELSMSQDRPDRAESRNKMRVNPRNIPVHIVFWAFVIFLVYLFIRAFAH